MYERFTDKSRKVMLLANQEALALNHEYVGTEHILLGLVKEGSGVAGLVLRGISLGKIRSEVDKIIQAGPDLITMGKLPHTPRTKKVIEFAMEEACNLNHNYVGTEHILLGLLREQEGVAAQVLMGLGLELEDVREKILDLTSNHNYKLYEGSLEPALKENDSKIESFIETIKNFEKSNSKMKKYIIKLSAKVVELELELMNKE